jgi:predicted RNA polymerase sigma factor
VTGVEAAVSAAYRAEWGRIVASLIRLGGDWDLAEECAQDAPERCSDGPAMASPATLGRG